MTERWLEAARTGDVQRELLDNLPLPVFVHDSDKIVYANQACIRFVGAVDAREIVGKQVLSFVHADGVSTARERVNLVFERDLHVTNAEVKVVLPDGTAIRCIVAGFPVQIFGRTLIAAVITEHERPAST